jgi:bifunctional non-homologous end joining protein LigD
MAGLSTYNAKRRFDVTGEPRGKAGKRGHAFVIQKHAARRLHYDLRLQVGGAMKSWAVTRGPSLVPGEKRLAVEVEDHPIDYNKFEGTIPKGEYGGGTVMIWDRGHWQPDGDPEYGLKKGHLAFHLEGEKLHGGWHLVRMHRRPGEKRNNWLLIKQTDDDARETGDKDILDDAPLSVTTGRSMDEIAAGAPRRKRKKAAATRTKKRKKTTARKVKKPARKKSARKSTHKSTHKSKGKTKSRPATAANLALVRTSSTPRHSKTAARKALTHGRRAALPAFVEPSLAALADKAPQDDTWIHEIKFDGYRIQARLDHGKVKLLTRKGLDWTAKFPSIADAVSGIDADTALLDGELFSEDSGGISRFSLLQQDLKAGRGDRMVFYAFDLLYLDGADLRPLPLTGRKEVLAKLIGTKARGPLRLSESLTEPGPALLKHACRLGLEGIIAKRAAAPYRSGRGHDWLKIKCSDRQEFVVAGFMPSTADPHAVGALVLGVNDRGKLKYAGRTGTGFTHETARALYRRFKAVARKTSPFEPVPKEERGRRGPVWIEPETVVEVDFRGWTHGDRVRQASFQGLREDKSAGDVVREQPAAAAAVATAPRKRSAPVKPRKGKETVGQVTLTHPDRIYWQDAGITKRDLADYYASVWKRMQPHVTGRPISLLRCPEGAEGQCFFQKHARAGIPEEFLHLVAEKGDKIISIDDLDGLIALVQGGVLEVHVRGSTIDNRERGDRLVFDLDPGPGTGWRDVIAAAREVRERLSRVKLTSFLKTSGGKGLHVVVPIAPAPWATVKRFCHAVALSMEKDEPDKYLSTAAKAGRQGRIFIDYLRNSREATAVAPYSTRARPGAPVSVPIDWSELGSLKSAAQYTVRNLAQRLSRQKKDPWAAIGRTRQALPDFK